MQTISEAEAWVVTYRAWKPRRVGRSQGKVLGVEGAMIYYRNALKAQGFLLRRSDAENRQDPSHAHGLALSSLAVLS